MLLVKEERFLKEFAHLSYDELVEKYLSIFPHLSYDAVDEEIEMVSEELGVRFWNTMDDELVKLVLAQELMMLGKVTLTTIENYFVVDVEHYTSLCEAFDVTPKLLVEFNFNQVRKVANGFIRGLDRDIVRLSTRLNANDPVRDSLLDVAVKTKELKEAKLKLTTQVICLLAKSNITMKLEAVTKNGDLSSSPLTDTNYVNVYNKLSEVKGIPFVKFTNQSNWTPIETLLHSIRNNGSLLENGNIEVEVPSNVVYMAARSR